MNFSRFPFRAAPAALVVLLAAGCAQVQMRPQVDVVEPTSVRAPVAVAPAAPPPQTSGSIYAGANYRSLFEDRRARFVGDVLTIQIQEKTSARQKSDTTLDRNGKLSGSLSALPGILGVGKRAKVGGESASSMDAKGETGSDNTFTGVITCTVVEVLPNGNLLVTGEKQVGVNQNVDRLRFSGVVNPATILPGNTVVSTQVADARVEYRGQGDLDRVQTNGWLTRFFYSILPI